jgi:hypothetical protein
MREYIAYFYTHLARTALILIHVQYLGKCSGVCETDNLALDSQGTEGSLIMKVLVALLSLKLI